MMGNNNITEYKVLWVTDIEEKDVDSCTKTAKILGLDLKRFSNWDDAEADLNKNFKDYSAIILSPQCKLHNDKKEGNVSSLMVVLSQLREIFALRYDTLAWYILAFGDKIPEQETMREIRSRMSSNDDWGERMVFDANSDDDKDSLFTQIKVVAERRYLNSVLYKHKDTLSCLGGKTTIDYPGAKKNLVKTLAALYDPQNFKYEYAKDYKDYANMLRQVLECMFKSAFKRGLLPTECFHDRNNRPPSNPNLKYSFDYMSGFSVPVGKKEDHYVRWGKVRADIGGVFSPEDARCLDDILNYFSEFSHYKDTDKVDKEQVFSYTMKLCHIIRRFDDYIKTNSTANFSHKKNKIKINKTSTNLNNSDDVINIKAEVKLDKSGSSNVYFIGPCKLLLNTIVSSVVGRTFIVEDAMLNAGHDKGNYPFIATKIRPSIFVQDNR